MFSRQVGDEVLEFRWADGMLTDTATGTTWNGALGLAVDGPLAGSAMRQVPHSSSYDWAWLLHNSNTTFFPPLEQGLSP